MKSIETSIEIDAAPEQVWRRLVNFKSYPKWNPFITSIKGQLAEGDQWQVDIQPPGQKAMTFKPTLLILKESEELRWLGHLWTRGIFDGEHYFRLMPANGGKTKFIHGEQFTGLLSGILFRLVGEQTKAGFRAMNQALKKNVEQKIAQ